MIKLFKILFGVILLVVIAIAGFVFTFDANNYKSEIIEQVEENTGRDFDIAGNIKLSIFPWIGLKVEQAALGNAKGFSERDFASMSQLDIKVKLLPLLSKNLKVDKVRLHGLEVSLEVDQNGINNWSDLSQPSDEVGEDKTEADQKDLDKPDSVEALAGIAVNGIEFIDASIYWRDAKTNAQTTVTGLSLETGAVRFNEPVDISFRAHVENSQPEARADINLDVQAIFNETFDVITLRQLELTIEALMQSVSKDPVELVFNTRADVDLKQQTVKLSDTRISSSGIVINANAMVTKLDNDPSISGSLSSNVINIRELAQQWQVELPTMANESSLTALSFSSQFNATASRATLEKLSVKLDSSEITGRVRVPDMAKSNLRYKLVLDTIKLDDYMSPVVEGASEAEDVDAVNDAAVDVSDEIALPVEMLRTLDLSGIFTISQASLQDIEMSDIELNIIALKGRVKAPITMKLLDGELTSQLNLNVITTPTYRLTVTAKDIHAGPVVNPVLKEMFVEEDIELQGKLNFESNINTQGSSLTKLKKAAKGKFVMDVNETVVSGVDIEYLTRNVLVDYMESKKLDVPADWRGEYKPHEATAFTMIHASGIVANGKVKNDDLIMDSARIKVTGKGEVDIVNNAMDYYSVVDMMMDRKQTFAEKLLDEPIGVRIHGAFETLEIDPDRDRIAKAVTNILTAAKQAEVKQKIEEEKQRIKEKTDAEKQAVQEKIDKKKDDSKKKLEDKFKDKFKGLF